MTDYLNVGCNGFAQVGDPLYSKKNLAEKDVLFSIIEENESLHIPEEFQGMASYSWKRFSHEFGTYHELVVVYYCDLLDQADEDVVTRFYEWFNTVESFDFETPEITERIQERYLELYPEEGCIVRTLKRAS